MNKVRYGIIGCGTIHHSHIEALAKLTEIADLTAVCDSDPAALAATVAKTSARGYGDLAEMVASPEIDAVIVCTPSGMHGDHAIAAMNAGKHAITEKPIDISLAKVDAMIAAARANDVRLSSISQTRYGKGAQQVHAWIDSGRLGKVVYGEAQIKRYRSQAYYDSAGWRGTWALDGGGALMNQGVHYVDQLRWAMGKPKSVVARMGTLGHRMECEDVVAATIEFENGAIGTLTATTCAYPGHEARLEVYGTGGSVRMLDEKIEGAQFVDGEKVTADQAAGGDTVAADPRSTGVSLHWHQLRDFTLSILEGREPEITAQDGRDALELVLAVYESARTGETVRL